MSIFADEGGEVKGEWEKGIRAKGERLKVKRLRAKGEGRRVKGEGKGRFSGLRRGKGSG